MKATAARLRVLPFGEPVAGHLPERVRNQIARNQADSEVLIGIILFAVLYALSPRTFTEDTTLEPVPWALGTCFLFTVIRLFLAHARRLPNWMIVASIVVDIAVLLVTIWSFHLQYAQPPGFSLQVPIMLCLFVLIALRTLRFDSRYVLMAGATAIAGWLVLLVYALHVAPVSSEVTRDDVHYLYTSDILIGGEVDKILTFLLVTGTLVVSTARNHGGTIGKFMGDGVMITFDATAPSESFAADTIDHQMKAWNQRRQSRGQRLMAWGTGLATGTVGDETRPEYTSTGEAVKLEQHCKIQGSSLVVTGGALDLAQQQGRAGRSLEMVTAGDVEGAAAPMDIAVLNT